MPNTVVAVLPAIATIRPAQATAMTPTASQVARTAVTIVTLRPTAKTGRLLTRGAPSGPNEGPTAVPRAELQVRRPKAQTVREALATFLVAAPVPNPNAAASQGRNGAGLPTLVPAVVATPLARPVVLRLLAKTAGRDAVVVVRLRPVHTAVAVVAERAAAQVRRVAVPEETAIPGEDLARRLQAQVLDLDPAGRADQSQERTWGLPKTEGPTASFSPLTCLLSKEPRAAY